MLSMIHPDIEAPAEALDKATFNLLWAPRGWKLMDEPLAFANRSLGRFIRSLDSLHKDEIRALVSAHNGEYPDEDATGAEVLETYLATFGARPAAPAPATESPAGVVLKLYDPSEHNVDEVVVYLEGVDEDEQLRVLEAEEKGKNRVTITQWTPAAPDDTDSAPADDAVKE
jgi:hypothetical protein